MRINHTFSLEELDSISPFHRNITEEERDRRNSLRQDICKRINKSNFDNTWILPKVIKGKLTISPENQDVAATLRKLYLDLEKLFKIKQSNRNRIIKQVLRLVNDTNDGFISKTDISAFYESIPVDGILDLIDESGLLGNQSSKYLRWIISRSKELGVSGLPRGISISPILAEIYMRKFDRAITEMGGVYFYARFVDDIIIFHTKEIVDFESFINSHFDQPLQIRIEKTFANKKTPLIGDFQYLGYKIQKKDGKKSAYVSLAEKKEERFKRKIIASIIRYKREKNTRILANRLRFLTANFPRRKGGGRSLLAGIYFNYPLLSDRALLPLDSFLRVKINSLAEWASRYQPSDKPIIESMRRYSFSEGWKRRIVYSHSLEEIKEIRKAWRYE